MIRTWVADVTPLYNEECYNRYYEGLPSFRKEKADALKYLSGKAQSVGVWVLWQKMRNRYGLPEDASFNLSHSGGWVMCAAQTDGVQSQVGCDIEKLGKDLMIGFNPRFLIDALRVIDDETITIYLVNPKAPCFIRDDENSYIYLILPVNFTTVA